MRRAKVAGRGTHAWQDVINPSLINNSTVAEKRRGAELSGSRVLDLVRNIPNMPNDLISTRQGEEQCLASVAVCMSCILGIVNASVALYLADQVSISCYK